MKVSDKDKIKIVARQEEGEDPNAFAVSLAEVQAACGKRSERLGRVKKAIETNYGRLAEAAANSGFDKNFDYYLPLRDANVSKILNMDEVSEADTDGNLELSPAEIDAFFKRGGMIKTAPGAELDIEFPT